MLALITSSRLSFAFPSGSLQITPSKLTFVGYFLKVVFSLLVLQNLQTEYVIIYCISGVM